VIAVIADSHLGAGTEDVAAFRSALDAIARRGVSAIYLLGDIFQYLIGDRKFASRPLAEFLDAIRALRARGTVVIYIEGNRDFFLRGSYLEPEFDAVVAEARFEVAGRRFLLVHGDGINEKDWPYRFWRRISKNRVACVAMKLVPRGAANRFVATMERRLRDTNFKHKSRLPEEMICAFAGRRFREGFSDVILGHFHKTWSREMPEGRVEIAPPFLEERRWIEIGDDGRTRVAALD
jgi:UDP-2,3-diacylglucosamine hydrolase